MGKQQWAGIFSQSRAGVGVESAFKAERTVRVNALVRESEGFKMSAWAIKFW